MKQINGFIDTKQAAEVLGVSVAEIYRLVRVRRLRHHRFGSQNGLIRFLKSDLEAYIQSCVVEPAEPKKGGDKKYKLKHLKG